jgi:predicted nucleic acid-binding Zn ribbon protein
MGLQEAIAEVRVRQAWAKSAPPELHRHLLFLHFRKGTLSLQPESSVWAQALRLASETIVRALNEALGEELVKKILCGSPRRAAR